MNTFLSANKPNSEIPMLIIRYCTGNMFTSQKTSPNMSHTWRLKKTMIHLRMVQPSTHFWMAAHLGKDLLHR